MEDAHKAIHEAINPDNGLMHFHQTAMYTGEKTDRAMERMHGMGYPDWSTDIATLTGEVNGRPMVARGLMYFQYGFDGHELEFLSYNGPSWHSDAGRTREDGTLGDLPIFLSHKSVHVEDLEKSADFIESLGFKMVQRFETSDHVNPVLIERRQHFIEAVFDAREWFGFDIKLIQRIFD